MGLVAGPQRGLLCSPPGQLWMVAEVRRFQVAVIGAGPAGLATVGCLLDANVQSLVWIDGEFGAGRLALYEAVPR